MKLQLSEKFSVIYADPPWSFRPWSNKGNGKAASNHYRVMNLAQIKAMKVESLADDDCVLLMWATMPMLPEALQVIEAWGFKFKTVAFTWMKQNKNTPRLFYDAKDIFMGTGYWTRANCELCLLATRGKPKRRSLSVAQAIFSPIREHSRKPDETYDRIEKLLNGPYIELFARTKREGWDSWGNETNKFKPLKAAKKGAPVKVKSPPKKEKKNVQ